MGTVDCPYCEDRADLVSGDVIYPHRDDLRKLKFWYCHACQAWTGTHRNSKTHEPKGRLANAELRRLRIAAHAAFDPKWQTPGSMTRKQAYAWLQSELRMHDTPHIGFMSEDECRAVISACSV